MSRKVPKVEAPAEAADPAPYATPDVTKIQGGATAAFAAAVVSAHLAGVDGEALHLTIAGAALVSVSLIIADSVIRFGRSKGATQ